MSLNTQTQPKPNTNHTHNADNDYCQCRYNNQPFSEDECFRLSRGIRPYINEVQEWLLTDETTLQLGPFTNSHLRMHLHYLCKLLGLASESHVVEGQTNPQLKYMVITRAFSRNGAIKPFTTCVWCNKTYKYYKKATFGSAVKMIIKFIGNEDEFLRIGNLNSYERHLIHTLCCYLNINSRYFSNQAVLSLKKKNQVV